MGGTYRKGDDVPDLIWSQFMEDIIHGELDELIGFPAAALEELRIDFSKIRPLPAESVNQVRKEVAGALKEYTGRQEEVTRLLQAHGEYCKALGGAKWKRVHNVLAYRYANPNPLTIRMIARKIGKGKEETDHDIREGLHNMALLLCGYPAIVKPGTDAYDGVASIIRNYSLLKTAAGIDLERLLPDADKTIAEGAEKSKRIICSFDRAVMLYSVFCEGYGETEQRRLDSLKSGYLQGRESVPSIAKRHNVAVTTIQNDNRINIRRLSGLLSCG